MKIYISLPISSRDISEARQHADLMKSALSRLGHTPVSPFDIYAGYKPDYYDYLCADLRALDGCDAIMMCRGWKNQRVAGSNARSPTSTARK